MVRSARPRLIAEAIRYVFDKKRNAFDAIHSSKFFIQGRITPRSRICFRPRFACALPDKLRPLLSFEIGPGAVEEIADKLVAWLTLDAAERERARSALATEAARRYSWENVARGVIAAAQGRLDELPRPNRPAL